MVPWVTGNFLAILSGLHQRYKDSKGSERKAVINQGIQEITASAEKDGVAVPPGLKKKVTVWFQNAHQRRQEGNPKISKVKGDGRAATTWTVRKVVKEQMSDELNALILGKDSSAQPGTRAYLKHVQGCLTELVTGLSQKKLRELEEVTALWNTMGVDSDLKAKQADKHFINAAKKFTDQVYKQMGVQVFMLVGYRNSEGDFVRSKVETDTFAPTKKQFTPIFNKVGGNVWNEWDHYLENLVDDDQKDTAQGSSKVIADRSVPWPLRHDEDGYPLLPDTEGKSLPDLKDIVRSFVTLSYRHAAHNPKASVPWSALVQTPDKFLEPCYLPAGVRLTEISKMQAKSLNACIHHWLECVENGNIAFCFKAVEESHLQAVKSKKKHAAPLTDDESSEEEHSIPQSPSQTTVGAGDVDGDDDDEEEEGEEEELDVNPVEEQTGKGKGKMLPPSCPADVPKDVQHQIEYLLSLSREEEYVQLVKQAADVLQDSDAIISGRPGPKWVSWSYKNKHLSGRFHSSSDGFEDFIKWLKTRPYCTDSMMAYPQSRVLVVCLGIGMLLHDLHVMQFDLEDPGSSRVDPAVAHLQKSKLDWAHNQVVIEMCLTIAGDLKACLDAGQTEDSGSPGPNRKKPPAKRQKKLSDMYVRSKRVREVTNHKHYSTPRRRSTRNK